VPSEGSVLYGLLTGYLPVRRHRLAVRRLCYLETHAFVMLCLRTPVALTNVCVTPLNEEVFA
jgi:hypothetical protein